MSINKRAIPRLLYIYGVMPYEAQSPSKVHILLKDKGQSSGPWEETSIDQDDRSLSVWYGQEIEERLGERGKL